MENKITKNKKDRLLTGFTIIELLVAIAIIGFLSGIILFGVSQYINKGKDSNVIGNLAVLVPSGEIYYNSNNNSYENFCESSVVINAKEQMPSNPLGNCYNSTNNPSGVCCYDSESEWASCAKKFSDPELAFCVDSRGRKKEIKISDCGNSIMKCP
jgi:prepilin-type N-terminal cleavage/methylation domain-containing protein